MRVTLLASISLTVIFAACSSDAPVPVPATGVTDDGGAWDPHADGEGNLPEDPSSNGGASGASGAAGVDGEGGSVGEPR